MVPKVAPVCLASGLLSFFFLRERGRGRGGGTNQGKGVGRERERDQFVVSLNLCIHQLILVCALTRDQTHNLGVSRQCSNQLSYPATFCRNIHLMIYLLKFQSHEDMALKAG